MNERGILFTGEMVNAILQDRKTMTRRMCKVQPVIEAYNHLERPEVERQLLSSCAYGKPGDRLWVRETWREDYDQRVRFRASAEHPEVHKWKPGIHLKRVHSRILLEMTAVRVERAQEISEEDAKAEGVTRDGQHPMDGYWARKAFRLLWAQINGLASWEANPLVYVISFKVLAKEPQTVRY